MDKKRILLLGAMGILLAAAIALGAVWIMEAAEYAGYKADYVDIAEDVLHSDEDDGMIELVPLSPAPKQNDTLDDPTASAATDQCVLPKQKLQTRRGKLWDYFYGLSERSEPPGQKYHSIWA